MCALDLLVALGVAGIASAGTYAFFKFKARRAKPEGELPAV